jgi:hypothetical protein
MIVARPTVAWTGAASSGGSGPRRAPAVCYRIEAGRTAVLYAPDVFAITDRKEALAGLDLDVGDGAAITRSIVRRRDGRAIRHASIPVQLDWCAAAGVPWAVFTHCGSEIVKGDARAIADRVDALGRERGIRSQTAYDVSSSRCGSCCQGSTDDTAVPHLRPQGRGA